MTFTLHGQNAQNRLKCGVKCGFSYLLAHVHKNKALIRKVLSGFSANDSEKELTVNPFSLASTKFSDPVDEFAIHNTTCFGNV